MCSYAHMLGKSTPKMAAIFVIVRKANSIKFSSNCANLSIDRCKLGLCLGNTLIQIRALRCVNVLFNRFWQRSR